MEPENRPEAWPAKIVLQHVRELLPPIGDLDASVAQFIEAVDAGNIEQEEFKAHFAVMIHAFSKVCLQVERFAQEFQLEHKRKNV